MDADTRLDRIRGCLFGLAYGDALGAKTEFIRNVAVIREQWPPDGPRDLDDNPAFVTDDTQMTLAVAHALIRAVDDAGELTPESVTKPIIDAFVEWCDSPDNNRAPGMTCMNACYALRLGTPWVEATVNGSKGCGANMRVAPVGLLTVGRNGVTHESRAGIAQLQAAITHGHPTGLVAAELTALACANGVEGGSLADLPQVLRNRMESQRSIYHREWIGTLYERSSWESPEDFISRGWMEMHATLDRLDAALANPDRDADPCIATGEGWIAEEALATALHCALLFPDDPPAALHRGAVTCGDSDSIACLAGAILGAHYGMDAWPRLWLDRIEYRDRLEATATRLAAM